MKKERNSGESSADRQLKLRKNIIFDSVSPAMFSLNLIRDKRENE